MRAPVPVSEPERLEALRRYSILDTLPEPDFDDLTSLAARICGTPMALVTLVDADRQWFKAKVGLETTETARDLAFCAYAILQPDLLIVPDASADQRFSTNPLVTGPPHIRFYAGAPLITPDGHALGTLCVVDLVPHELTPDQANALRALSRQVVAQLELRRTRTDLESALRASEEFKTRLVESSQDCINLLDLDGRWISVNAGGMRTLEISDFAPLKNSYWIESWRGEHREAARAAVEAARRGRATRFIGYCPTMSGKPMWWDVVVSAVLDSEGKPERLLAVSRDITERKRAEEALRKSEEWNRTLLEINNAIITNLTQESLFHSVSEALQKVLPFDRAAFTIYNPERGTFRFLAMESRFESDYFRVGLEYDGKESIAGWVFDHQQGVVRRDLEKEHEYPNDRRLVAEGIYSYCVVPLIVAGKSIGTLNVGSAVKDQYSEADLEFLQEVANQVALAVGNMKAYEEIAALNSTIARTAERYRTLLEINNAIITHLTQESFFRSVSEALRRVIPFDKAAFLIYQPERGSLRLLSIEGQFHSDYYRVGMEFDRTDSSISAWVVDHQKGVVRRDLEKEQQSTGDRRLVAEGIKSYCVAPLIVSGKSIGTLTLWSESKNRYSEADLEFLQEVANQVALAVENVRSYEEIAALNTTVTGTADRLRTLLEINNAIITNLSQEALLRSIAAALRRVVPFDRAAMTLYLPDKDVFRFMAVEGDFVSDYFRPGLEIDPKDNSVGWVFHNQRPIVRRDLEKEQQYSNERRLAAEGMRSHCVVPLTVRSKSIGTFNVASGVKDQYSERDAEFLQEVANQVALAVENMQSYEEIAALKARLEKENIYLQEEIRTEHNFEEIVGNSPALLSVLRKVEQVAPTDSTVLIYGETGTGKELIARAIHDRSGRKDRALVKVNCSAISAGLVESELFGHVKGAFTGAIERHIGRFELADGGTIFLDEVGELPPETQVKLLRVLQEREFERVGSSRPVRVDVRVTAATNRNLKEAVETGRFRSDLFYRLNVFPIEVPPLRDRRSDIPQLVTFYLSRYCGRFGKKVEIVSKETLDTLMGYSWPGNVRELQNVIERAVVLSQGPTLNLNHILLSVPVSVGSLGTPEVPVPETQPAAATPSNLPTLEEVERGHILTVLQRTRGVVEGPNGAARILNLHPNTLRHRMQKLGIKWSGYRPS